MYIAVSLGLIIFNILVYYDLSERNKPQIWYLILGSLIGVITYDIYKYVRGS